MSEPLIAAQDVSYWIVGQSFFGGHSRLRAVSDVSLTIGKGEVVGLVGESGSGKSTLGRALTAEIFPQQGRILFDGKDLSTLGRDGRKALRRRAQVVFQDPFSSLDPRRTIGAQIGDGMRIHGLRPGSEIRGATIELLAAVGLTQDHLDRYPWQFSGGQRQRIAIARALSTDPELIVADEPVSALDVSVQAQIVALMLELKRKRGLSMLFISHDLAVVRYISDRVLVMYLGRIMESATTDKIFSRPRHPYTRALLAASPTIGGKAADAELIGEPPSPFDPPSGCVFRTRCPFAIEECSRAIPPLAKVEHGHESACIRPEIANA